MSPDSPAPILEIQNFKFFDTQVPRDFTSHVCYSYY